MSPHARHQKKKNRSAPPAANATAGPNHPFLNVSSRGGNAESALPPGFGMNPHAWVLVHRADHHYCNDREKFSTFHEIHPVPIVGTSWLAQGIGIVELQIRESSGEISTLFLEDVLYVPKIVVNLIAMSTIGSKDYPLARMDDRTGILKTRHGEEIAHFHYPDGNVATLKLADENGRLWPGWMREEEKPPLVLEAYVHGEVQIKEPTENIALGASAVSALLQMAEKEQDNGIVRELLDFKVNLTVGELLALAPALNNSTSVKRRMRKPQSLALSPRGSRRPTISRHQFVKMHWGSYTNFMSSHGLRHSPEHFEDAKDILDTYLPHHEFSEDEEEDEEDEDADEEDKVELVEHLEAKTTKLTFYMGTADIVPIRRDSSISSWFE